MKSGAYPFASDDGPTFEELEQKVADLTRTVSELRRVLHIAFVSVCTLQCERDRARYGAKVQIANEIYATKVRRDGLRDLLVTIEK